MRSSRRRRRRRIIIHGGRRGTTKGIGAAVSVRHDPGMQNSTVEHALNDYGFSPDDGVGVFAAGPEIDQRPTRTVVKNELVTEYLGNASFHGEQISSRQFVDSRRL